MHKTIDYFDLKDVSKLKEKVLVANLNLYNWRELNERYDLDAKSEFEFLLLFLNEFSIGKVDELKGAYAFAYYREDKIYLMRDVVGIKPICFFKGDKEFAFSSRLKVLPKGAVELNPREYVVYDLTLFKMEVFERGKYYDVSKINDESYLETKSRVKELFTLAVKRRIIGAKKIGILFSGGTDSTLMALTLKELNVDFTCYSASIVGGNITEGDDIYYARKIAKECSFDWKIAELDLDDVEEVTKEIIEIIESRDYVKVSVALALYVALKRANKDGVDFMFTGIGSEEVFADYKRNSEVEDINETCLEGLKSLWIRDLYRDNTLACSNNIELKFPFLDDDFVDYSIRINSEFKINKENQVNKVILRDILRDFGLSEKLVSRKKKAAQYGSRSDRVFEKISRRKGMQKREYLNSL